MDDMCSDDSGYFDDFHTHLDDLEHFKIVKIVQGERAQYVSKIKKQQNS